MRTLLRLLTTKKVIFGIPNAMLAAGVIVMVFSQ